MFTTLKAELLLHEVNAQIDHCSAMVRNLEDEALTLESACDRFACDACRVINTKVAIDYSEHVLNGAKHLRKMVEWYEHRLEIEERKRAKLRNFLKATADEDLNADATAGTVEVESSSAEPAYDAQTWAIDFDIYHADSDLTSDELADCERKLREALTADGNTGIVSYEDSVITVYGNDGGDNKRIVELLEEMYKHGCWCEVYDKENDELIQVLSFGLNDLVGLPDE